MICQATRARGPQRLQRVVGGHGSAAINKPAIQFGKRLRVNLQRLNFIHGAPQGFARKVVIRGTKSARDHKNVVARGQLTKHGFNGV